jgi:hypothetical protein
VEEEGKVSDVGEIRIPVGTSTASRCCPRDSGKIRD